MVKSHLGALNGTSKPSHFRAFGALWEGGKQTASHHPEPSPFHASKNDSQKKAKSQMEGEDTIFLTRETKIGVFEDEEEQKNVLTGMEESGFVCFDSSGKATVGLFSLFEIIMNCLKELKRPVSLSSARKYFAEMRQFILSIEETNRFVSFGPVFASSLFASEMNKEIADSRRMRMGLAVLEGLHPCPKCKAPKEKTTAVERQTRRADEAIPLLNLCLVCNYRWQIG